MHAAAFERRSNTLRYFYVACALPCIPKRFSVHASARTDREPRQAQAELQMNA